MLPRGLSRYADSQATDTKSISRTAFDEAIQLHLPIECVQLVGQSVGHALFKLRVPEYLSRLTYRSHLPTKWHQHSSLHLQHAWQQDPTVFNL